MSNLEIIENKFSLPLDAKGFTIRQGWSDELAEQLVAASFEPEIVERTPGDYTTRFPNIEAAHRWYNKKQGAS